MLTGAEVLLKSPKWIKKIQHGRLAYLGHFAAVNQRGGLILDDLFKKKELNLTSLFGPQHGFSSVKQANMVTTEDESYRGLPLYSLYSKENRRLTSDMAKSFDILLFDLQDTGCRIYTYLTSLFYLIEDCEKFNKTLMVLDRPNPLGRYIEGNRLKKVFYSFVGLAEIPISHGLTLGELALWYKHTKGLKTDLFLVPMENYKPLEPWSMERPWVLPSPNITALSCVKCYPGTVLLEGTQISEGRGTVKPFEIFGHPQMETQAIKSFIKNQAPSILDSCFLRELEFEPVFDKFQNKACQGFQIHLEKAWSVQETFQPYRLICLFLKAFIELHSELPWKLKAPYEYEFQKDPIDIISGSKDLQKWLLNSSASFKEWEAFLFSEEEAWSKERKDFLVY